MPQRIGLSKSEMAEKPVEIDTVIIGAGPAGLAVGACLQQAGVPFVILERSGQVGSAWHHHYDRLHLHTHRKYSGLPYFPFPKHYAKYPSRLEVIDYLEAYAQQFELKPKFGQNVTSARFIGGLWKTQTEEMTYLSRHLVIATGNTREPSLPTWPGQASFQGSVIHSSEYKNGEPFRGRRVLIVGFGNSGGEIAIDLWEHGAKVGISVRSPSNIIPRDLFGIPIMALALLLGKLPAPIGDALTAPILRIVIGDLTRFGLRKLPYGPMTQIKQDSRIPLIDIGTLDLIRQGHIEICRGIERFTADRVVFTDASEKTYDAVILATGYRARIDSFLENVPEVLDESGNRRGGDGRPMPGLYFCGFHVPPTGVLREIAIEAQNISGHIAQKNSGPARARHENVGRN